MGQPDDAAGFKVWLERGLGSGSSAGGSSIAERMEQRVEAQVMGRVRALGARPSGADERDGHKSARADGARAERGTAGAQRAERADDEASVERPDEREEPNEPTREDAGGAARTDAPRDVQRPRSLEGRARALQAADAADASGAEAPSSGDAPRADASSGAAVPPSAPPVAVNALDSAYITGASPALAPAAPGGAGASASSNASPVAAVEGPRAQAGPKASAAAEPAPRSASTEDLELAEKVMRQLRARLQIGQREALIELRPSELGRIGVRLRFEDGALTATIRAERPETLAVLEAHAPELRAWLAQDGAEVREIDLALAERGALFEEPQQRQRDSAQGRHGGSATSRALHERAQESSRALPRTNTDTPMPDVDMSGVDLLV